MFSKFSSSTTPKSIKIVIGISVLLTLLCSIVKSLIFVLGFSKLGLEMHFFWQPVTFLFLHAQTGRIDLFSMFNLFFYMYALWIAGSEIILQKKLSSFLILFFGAGLISATSSYLLMEYFQNVYILLGMKYTTFSLLIGWMMIHPSARILLFHSFPVQVSQIVSAFVIIQALTFLSNGEYLHFINAIVISASAYLYSILAWKATGPYRKLHSFETKLGNLFRKKTDFSF